MSRISLVAGFICSFTLQCSSSHFDADDVDGMFLLQQRSTAHRIRQQPASSTQHPQHPAPSKQSASALFVAGLEGSGHHLWYDLVQAMYNETEKGTLPFELRQTWLPGKYYESGLVREVSWQCEHKWKHSDLDLGVELFANITNHVGHYHQEDYGDDAIWITPESCLSYPCGQGTHKQKQNDFIPRADWLAEAAALVDGIQLHIGFLYRPLEELLMSNCIHRQMEETCDLYAETLLTNAAALLEQLQAIHAMSPSEKPILQCLRYGDMATFPRGLGVLFNHKMDFHSILGEIWKPNSTDGAQDHHYDEDPRGMVPNWDELVESLQSMDAQLKDACELADSAPI